MFIIIVKGTTYKFDDEASAQKAADDFSRIIGEKIVVRVNRA